MNSILPYALTAWAFMVATAMAVVYAIYWGHGETLSRRHARFAFVLASVLHAFIIYFYVLK